jgi:hypothetical protein
MDIQQFAELLKSPLLVAQLPADALRELVAQYPFSASLQMLLLKQYQLNDHPAYDDQLAKAAIYAPDRRSLYRLVQLRETSQKNTQFVSQASEIATNVVVVETAPADEAEVVEEVFDIEDTNLDTRTPSAVSEPENIMGQEEYVDTNATVEETVATIIVESLEAVEGPVTLQAESPEIHQSDTVEVILIEQLSGIGFIPPIIPVAHLEGLKEAQPEKEPLEIGIGEVPISEVAVEEENAASIEQVAGNETPETKPQVETEVIAIEELPVIIESLGNDKLNPFEVGNTERPSKLETTKDSFTGWLQRIKRHELPLVAPVPMDAHDLKEKAALDALFGAGTYEATLVQESINMPTEDPAPKAVPTREELMEPDEEANRRMDEQAKKSLSMDDDLVTETLARIYEIQKKTGKAIEAYQVLKLRYPENTDLYNAKIQALRAI